MKNQNLTQYLFYDGHEQIANSDGRLIAIKDPEKGVTDYIHFKGGLVAKYIKGSVPDEYSGFSKPKVGEFLLSGLWSWGLFPRLTASKIKSIDKKFQFPKEGVLEK